MNCRTPLMAGALAAATLFAGAAQGDDAWIKDRGDIVLRSDPNAAGSDIVHLLPGAKVKTGDKQGAWTKITTESGKVGWVTSNSLSIRQVKVSGLSGGNDAAKSSSAAAAKGLEPLSAEFAKNAHLSDAGLNQMAAIKNSITLEMQRSFMEEGRLGAAAAPPPPPGPSK